MCPTAIASTGFELTMSPAARPLTHEEQALVNVSAARKAMEGHADRFIAGFDRRFDAYLEQAIEACGISSSYSVEACFVYAQGLIAIMDWGYGRAEQIVDVMDLNDREACSRIEELRNLGDNAQFFVMRFMALASESVEDPRMVSLLDAAAERGLNNDRFSVPLSSTAGNHKQLEHGVSAQLTAIALAQTPTACLPQTSSLSRSLKLGGSSVSEREGVMALVQMHRWCAYESLVHQPVLRAAMAYEHKLVSKPPSPAAIRRMGRIANVLNVKLSQGIAGQNRHEDMTRARAHLYDQIGLGFIWSFVGTLYPEAMTLVAKYGQDGAENTRENSPVGAGGEQDEVERPGNRGQPLRISLFF
jgi:hypothetical protein